MGSDFAERKTRINRAAVYCLAVAGGCEVGLVGGGLGCVYDDVACESAVEIGLAVHIRRGGSLGSSTLRALSAPVTGRPVGSSNPTCTSTPA